VCVYIILLCVLADTGAKKTEKYTHENTGRWEVVITRCAGVHGLSIILCIPHAADDNAPKVYAFSEILFKSIKKNPNLSTPFDAFYIKYISVCFCLHTYTTHNNNNTILITS